MTDFFQPDRTIQAKVLASDLDGTLIPLPGEADNRLALGEIKALAGERGVPIVFATGRRFDSVMEAMEEYELPEAEWIVCDVGSSIYRQVRGRYVPFGLYEEHLGVKVGSWDREAVERRMGAITGVELQAPIHQQAFKVSFECGPERVEGAVEEMTAACVEAGIGLAALGSVDPFENRGLVDLLPVGVNKAYALVWLSTHADFRPEEVVFSGDSGNDLAGLVSGFRATIVGNAAERLRAQVRELAEARGLGERIYFAEGKATSGVLEGARFHGLFKGDVDLSFEI